MGFSGAAAAYAVSNALQVLLLLVVIVSLRVRPTPQLGSSPPGACPARVGHAERGRPGRAGWGADERAAQMHEKCWGGFSAKAFQGWGTFIALALPSMVRCVLPTSRSPQSARLPPCLHGIAVRARPARGRNGARWRHTAALVTCSGCLGRCR